MCRRTVVKLHAKSLPMSTDLDTVLRRDDELYDFKAAAERGEQVQRRRPANAMAALEQFGAGSDQEHGTDDPGDPRPGDGITIEHGDAAAAGEDELEPTVGELIGKAQSKPPKDPETFKLLARQLIAAAKPGDAEMLNRWWNGPNARSMRNRAQMTAEDTAEMAAEINAAVQKIAGETHVVS
jgi:hypothetical protein